MLNDIKSLSRAQALGVALGFFGIISPGLLLIYLYKPDLFSSLESLKLILFSVSLCLPVVIINLLLMQIYDDKDKAPFLGIVMSLALSSLVFYPSILLAYIFAFSFKYFLLTLALIQLTLALLFIIGKKHDDAKKSNN